MPKVADIRSRRAERKRHEILQAGLKVFARKGFHAATMDDIALELDATKGFLYYHFRNKEDLLHAILENDALLDRVDQIFEDAVRLPLDGALREIAVRLFQLFLAERHLVRFLHVQALLSTAEAQVIYGTVLKRLHADGARLVRRFQDKGEVRRSVDAEAVGRSIIDQATVHFIESEVFGTDLLGDGRYVESLIEVLLHGVAVPRRRSTKKR
ncbi:MAG: TetR/AcrR family transcriptional regulator [Candidatus Binatia bacterium]